MIHQSLQRSIVMAGVVRVQAAKKFYHRRGKCCHFGRIAVKTGLAPS